MPYYRRPRRLPPPNARAERVHLQRLCIYASVLGSQLETNQRFQRVRRHSQIRFVLYHYSFNRRRSGAVHRSRRLHRRRTSHRFRQPDHERVDHIDCFRCHHLTSRRAHAVRTAFALPGRHGRRSHGPSRRRNAQSAVGGKSARGLRKSDESFSGRATICLALSSRVSGSPPSESLRRLRLLLHLPRVRSRLGSRHRLPSRLSQRRQKPPLFIPRILPLSRRQPVLPPKPPSFLPKSRDHGHQRQSLPPPDDGHHSRRHRRRRGERH
mmetsp:Transcript_614/g.2240  ORF Transcript_614/g.2240 Transcript_614/m.2240 type:complete len:267 (-) Transcript_614:311-1111(-)